MFEALLMGHDDWVFSVQWQKPYMATGKEGVRISIWFKLTYPFV